MILVTGGTGMVGAHVLFACAKKKLPTLALFRTKKHIQKVEAFFKLLAPENPEYFKLIEWQEADLTEVTKLDKLFTKATVVYHCAAKVSHAQYHTEKLIKTNIEGTANAVNFALKHKVKKFAFVSSIASLGVEATVPFVNEDHLWNSGELHTPYAYSKYGAELEVWRGSQEGLDVVIVNPGIILGSHFWNRSSGTLIKRVAKGMLFYPTGNAGIVAIEDVVNVLIKLMESSIKNERFILVSENLKYKELIEKIALGLNSKKPKFALTNCLLYLLYILDKIAHAIGLKKSFLNRATIESLCSQQQYDGSKIMRTLDFTYQDSKLTFKKISENFKAYSRFNS
ncbi:NAD-dependent epimerase/dehydratase family protein [Flavobacteriaceae bacterium]|nr:NAD-dependent epimerase/dehydratase family protein [Flavobacteriaceae bacterium]MDA9016119.1 NAD-dependent epimerase/dehydratase family protein [Flavobacteriaceae bacterium]